MRRQTGFSMVELMVALTLALVVSGALMSVFMGSRSAYQATTGTAAMTDGGRVALDFISQSLRNAGYMSCATTARTVSNLNPGASPLLDDVTFMLAGFEAAGTAPGALLALPPRPAIVDNNIGDWLAGFEPGGLDPVVVGPTNASPPVQNSDILALTSALPNTIPVNVTVINPGSTNFTVDNIGNLAAGQLAVVSDCLNALAFQVSGVAGTTVNHIGGANAAGAFPVNVTPGVGAFVMPVTTRVYYIGVGVDGDGALFAYDTNGGTAFTPVELVDDIENMQILYGVDTTPASQTVASYVTADQVPSWNNVINVRVALLAASPLGAGQVPAVAPVFNLLGTQVTAPLDTRSRRVFTMDITVRNAVVTGN
jgi:type IV pilus assembly protein PilW